MFSRRSSSDCLWIESKPGLPPTLVIWVVGSKVQALPKSKCCHDAQSHHKICKNPVSYDTMMQQHQSFFLGGWGSILWLVHDIGLESLVWCGVVSISQPNSPTSRHVVLQSPPEMSNTGASWGIKLHALGASGPKTTHQATWQRVPGF